MFKQKRRVRIHVQDGPTLEGVLVGRTRHTYVLWAPKLLTDAEDAPEVEVSGHVEVPSERVLWFQVIG